MGWKKLPYRHTKGGDAFMRLRCDTCRARNRWLHGRTVLRGAFAPNA